MLNALRTRRLHVLLTLTAIAGSAATVSAQLNNPWVTFHNDQSKIDFGIAPDPSTEVDYAWGDLDQDGWIDVVVVRKQILTSVGKRENVLLMNELGVLVNRTAEYATASDVPGDQGFATPTNDRDVVIHDLDGDGWLDVTTATTISDGDPKHIGHPRIYMNLGADEVTGEWLGLEHQDARIPQLLHFVSGLPLNPRFCSVAAGDVTGDGYPDLYFGDYDSSGVGGSQQPAGSDMNDRLLVNDGTGHFVDESQSRMTQAMLLSAFAMAVVIEDMNLDGHNDILKDSALNAPQFVSAAYNNPSSPGDFDVFPGVFDQFHAFAPYHINTGDLNNDGRPDIVISDDTADRYRYNLGTDAFGRVEWGPARTYTHLDPSDADNDFNSNNLVADLDGDGWNDVVVADVDVDEPVFTRFRVYHNPGGTPGDEIQLVEEREMLGNGGWIGVVGMMQSDMTISHDVAVFDLDRDGDNDMLLGRSAGEFVWVNDTNPVFCQLDLGLGGPGSASLGVCGQPLTEIGGATLTLQGATPNAPAFLAYGLSSNPIPFLGGTLVPVPFLSIVNLTTDGSGEINLPISGLDFGPAEIYLQVLYLDGGQPLGVGFSNAVRMSVL